MQHRSILDENRELELLNNFSYAEQNFLMIHFGPKVKGSIHRGHASRVNPEFKKHSMRPNSALNYSDKDHFVRKSLRARSAVPHKINSDRARQGVPLYERDEYIEKKLSEVKMLHKKRERKLEKENEDSMLEEVRRRRERKLERKRLRGRKRIFTFWSGKESILYSGVN